jgi:general secretion pathway protein K
VAGTFRSGARDQGFALISVLCVTGLLAVLIASFASSARTGALLARNAEESAKAEALADAGVHWAVLQLLNPDSEPTWPAGDAAHLLPLGDGDARVRIEDEEGKIDLNRAPVQLLAGLLVALGLSEENGRALAERIGAFRDTKGGATQRPFATESEFVNVLGMTQRLYERVRPYVTVRTGATGIDPTRAARPVLEALPGITAPEIEALLAAGQDVDPLRLITGDQARFLQLEPYIVPSREAVFTIRALGRTSGHGRFLRVAVVELDASASRGFIVHVWSRAAESDMAD